MNEPSFWKIFLDFRKFPSIIVLSVIQCVFKVEMVPVYHERCHVSYLLSPRPQGLLSLGVKATAPEATRLYDTRFTNLIVRGYAHVLFFRH